MDAVLIDLYDTLVWSEWSTLRDRLSEETGADKRTLMRAFMATRVERGVGAFGSAEGDLRAVLVAAGLEPSHDELTRIARLERETLLNGGVRLYEDSVPALRALRERGVRTAIVSNCDHVTRPIVERLGLSAEVDEVVLSFEVGVMKPDAGIYRAALDRLGADAERAVFVDDQPGYLEGAEAIGMRAFFIMREEWELEDGEPGDRPVIRDLWEVVRAVPEPG